MKTLFDKVSYKSSKITTVAYSTSFSAGIRLLDKNIRADIYAIYGFVRFADEIVDTFHDYPKAQLLSDFKRDTYLAIETGISLNPILNSFQLTVNKYNIKLDLIETFLQSMEMDLNKTNYNQEGYEQYIFGSAEAVGLMCLHVFCYGNQELYDNTKTYAMSLGSAFQKINFLRDMKADYEELGRTYFPGINMNEFNDRTKKDIERDIKLDFEQGLIGIKMLPKSSRFGVYMAYVYYFGLFKKIRKLPSHKVMSARIRIASQRKYGLFIGSYVRHSLNLI